MTTALNDSFIVDKLLEESGFTLRDSVDDASKDVEREKESYHNDLEEFDAHVEVVVDSEEERQESGVHDGCSGENDRERYQVASPAVAPAISVAYRHKDTDDGVAKKEGKSCNPIIPESEAIVVEVQEKMRKFRDRTGDHSDQDEASERAQEWNHLDLNRVEDCVASLVTPPDKPGRQSLHIFKFGEDQSSEVRKKLASRKDKPGPVRRVVLPKYISSQKGRTGMEGQQAGGQSDMMAATMAASAVAAAAQPYIKAQQDLEHQIAELSSRLKELDKLAQVVSSNRSSGPGGAEEGGPVGEWAEMGGWGDTAPALPPPLPLYPHDGDLYTARRLDEVERLQRQQLELQNRLVALHHRLGDSESDYQSHPGPQSVPTAQPITLAAGRGPKKASFLQNLMTQDDAVTVNNPPRLPLSTDNAKELTDEINSLRKEFRNQLNEMRKLLSHKRRTVVSERSTSCSNLHANGAVLRTQGDGEDKGCPLDRYLPLSPPDGPTRPRKAPSSDLRRSIETKIAKAMQTCPSSMSVEIENILEQVTRRRANLENNLTAIRRTKEGQVIYSLIDLLQRDEDSAEKARLRAMVDDAVQAISKNVKMEVKTEWETIITQRQRQQATTAPHRFGATKSTIASRSRGRPPVKTLPITSRYSQVSARVDTGLCPRSVSPVYTEPQRHHSPFANRRRARTPYLHFVNEVKGKKSVLGQLQMGRGLVHIDASGDEARKSPSPPRRPVKEARPAVHFEERRTKTKDTALIKKNTGLIPLGIRQYSMQQDEREHPVTKESAPQEEIRSSSRLSEEGDGLRIPGYHREKQHRPAGDPLEMVVRNQLEDEIMAQVLTDFARRRQVVPTEDDDSEERLLRELIEEALRDQISAALAAQEQDLPSSAGLRTPSLSEDDEVPPHRPVTPARSYTEEFVSEDSSLRSPIRTGRSEEDTDYLPSRHDVVTPDLSTTELSTRMPSEDRPLVPQRPRTTATMQTQTIQDTGTQMQTDEAAQTSEATPRTPPRPARVEFTRVSTRSEEIDEEEEVSSTRSYLSDTVPDSISEGAWMLDRSEGQTADVDCDRNAKMRLGPMPAGSEEFDWTADQRTEEHSDGEFLRPTRPFMPADLDPVLNLLSSHRYTVSASMEESLSLIGQFRDEVRRDWRTPHARPGNGDRSEGEATYGAVSGDFEEDGAAPMPMDHPDGRYHTHHSSEYVEERSSAARVIHIRESAESNTQADMRALMAASMGTQGQSLSDLDTHGSDRLNIDLGQYLGRSSISERTETVTGTHTATGMLSTNQIIADALQQTGGTSMEMSGPQQPFQSLSQPKRLSVTVPSLDTVQSDNSEPDISEVSLVD